MPSCTQCGTANSEAARFCNQCGNPLAAAASRADPRAYTPRHLAEKILQSRSAIAGERKRVTVLFADLKGSTRLAEEAGAEAWHSILDRYFAILTAAVHRYEGTVNQYTGDGVMALFGAPLAHEDHARRACLAALEAQAGVRQWADELRLEAELNVSMRIGLNSGEVIVGRIGDDLRMDYTAQGITVNLAARMEHICEPGRIYCSQATASLVEGYIALRDLGEMRVAGASQAVHVHEVQGEGPLRTRLERQLARGAASFLGRAAEVAALNEALVGARAGRGQIIAVIGDAGIGKSRLCHEFTLDCERQGLALHRSTGVPYGSALPLFPIQTLARSRFGLGERSTPAEARRLAAGSLMLFDAQAAHVLPPLLEFLGAGDRAARVDFAADRDTLFAFLARFLPRADQPQVLLVEDLHFADPATEAFLAGLAAEIANTPTLLLLNFRPSYAAEWLQGLNHRRLPLSALDDSTLERVALELLGGDPAMPPLAAELRRRAGGNPFFVEEAVQALVESGHLAGPRGHYTLAQAIDEWPVPDTVQALLAARIDRLDEQLKSLLQSAAVIGQNFSARSLAALTQLELSACESLLSSLCETGLIAAVAGNDYGFAHPLMQDIAYRTQLEKRRMATHRTLAEQLEAAEGLNAPPGAAAMATAHHWMRAGEWQRAGAWNLHASRWAITREVRITQEQCRLAIENLARAPRSPEVDHLRIAACAGLIRQAQFSGQDVAEIERVYAEGCALATDTGDDAGLAELMISYSSEQLHRGDAREAVRLAERGVRLAVDSGARDLVNRFRLALLVIASSAGYMREGLMFINLAGGTDWQMGAVGENNYLSRGFYGFMLGWLGRLEEGSSYLGAAIDCAEQMGVSASWMYANRVELAFLSGEPAGVLAQARLSLQRAEVFGSPFFRAVSLRALATAHIMQKEYATAARLLEPALPLVAAGAPGYQFESSTFATLARAYIGNGQLQDGFELAMSAVRSAQRSHSSAWELACWTALFTLPAEGPWKDQALAGIDRVGELLEFTGAESARPWWWLAQARWARSVQEAAAAHDKALEGFAAIGAYGHLRQFTSAARAGAA